MPQQGFPSKCEGDDLDGDAEALRLKTVLKLCGSECEAAFIQWSYVDIRV